MSFVQCSTAVHHYILRRGADGSPLTVEADAAESPVLVFVNGLGTNLHIWDGVLEELPQSWTVLRYDLRGHGLSEVGVGPHGIPALSADLSELLDRLGIRSVVLCGLSLGGMIAQEFALTEPERVRGVCLCATAPRIGSAETWQQRIDQIEAGGLAAITDVAMGRWFGAPFREREPSVVRGCRGMLERTSHVGYVAAAQALRDADLTARVSAIAAPALVVAGELDVSTPPEQMQALAAALRGARFELLPQTGHLLSVEQPQALARALVPFARGLMPEPRAASLQPDERLVQGMKVRRAVLGHAHVDRASREATEFDRDFQEYVTRAVWGEVWVRPGLTLEARHLVTIAMLAALNRQDELAMHIAATRNTGVSVAQIKEVLMQVAVYAGAPAAHAALKTAKRVLYAEG
jgi:3-oxoadipate enol-lactonase / 4-carboxymuconolactone decarboxylase